MSTVWCCTFTHAGCKIQPFRNVLFSFFRNLIQIKPNSQHKNLQCIIKMWKIRNTFLVFQDGVGVNAGTRAGARAGAKCFLRTSSSAVLRAKLFIVHSRSCYFIHVLSTLWNSRSYRLCCKWFQFFFWTGKFEDNGACFFVFVVLNGNVSNQFPIRGGF